MRAGFDPAIHQRLLADELRNTRTVLEKLSETRITTFACEHHRKVNAGLA